MSLKYPYHTSSMYWL